MMLFSALFSLLLPALFQLSSSFYTPHRSILKNSFGKITVIPRFVSTAGGDVDGGEINSVPDAKYCPSGQPYPPKPFDPPSGWKGGFEESNPKFAYPVKQPDLSSIPVTTNLANIDKLTRQMKVKWPEFSWQMVPGDETTRTYVKFAEYISRYGYDNEGRIWSIICPQQGATAGSIGEFNVEVTVTGVRGWVNEPKREVAAEMGVMGQIWFTTDKEDNPNLKALANFMDKYTDFPFTKSKSIRIQTNEVGNPNQPLFRNEMGMSKDFKTPSFAQHWYVFVFYCIVPV
jgi:hypothetical protein